MLQPGADLIVATNDAKYVRVAGRDTYPRDAGPDTLTLIDASAMPPRLLATVEVGHHPQGLAINRAGDLLLAAIACGTVAVLAIAGKTVTLRQTVTVSTGRLAGVSFTPDGCAALVALRDEQGLAVFDVMDVALGLRRERVTTGIAPYAVDVSGCGRWAVVGNVGPGARASRRRGRDEAWPRTRFAQRQADRTAAAAEAPDVLSRLRVLNPSGGR